MEETAPTFLRPMYMSSIETEKHKTFRCLNGNYKEVQNLFVASLTSAHLEFAEYKDAKWKLREFNDKQQTVSARLNVIQRDDNVSQLFTLTAKFFSGEGDTVVEVVVTAPSSADEDLNQAVWDRTELMLQASFGT